MVFRNLVSKLLFSLDEDIQGLPYHASAASNPPTRGLFPLPGNGINELSEKMSNLSLKLRYPPRSKDILTSGDAGHLVDTLKAYQARVYPRASDANVQDKKKTETSTDKRGSLRSGTRRCIRSHHSHTLKTGQLISKQKPYAIDIFEAQAAVRKLFFTEIFDARPTLLSTKEISGDTTSSRVASMYGEEVADRNMNFTSEEFDRKDKEESELPGKRFRRQLETPELRSTVWATHCLQLIAEEAPNHHADENEGPHATRTRPKASSFSHNTRPTFVRPESECRRPNTAGSLQSNLPSLMTPSSHKDLSGRDIVNSTSTINLSSLFSDHDSLSPQSPCYLTSAEKEKNTSSTSKPTVVLSRFQPSLDLRNVEFGLEYPARTSSLNQTSTNTDMHLTPSKFAPKKHQRSTKSSDTVHVATLTDLKLAGLISPVRDNLEHREKHTSQVDPKCSESKLPVNRIKPLPGIPQKLSENGTSQKPNTSSKIRRSEPKYYLNPLPESTSSPEVSSEDDNNDHFDLPGDSFSYPKITRQSMFSNRYKFTPNTHCYSDLYNSDVADSPSIPLSCEQEAPRRKPRRYTRNSVINSITSSKNIPRRNNFSRRSFFSGAPELTSRESLQWIETIRFNGLPTIRSISPLSDHYSSDEDEQSDQKDEILEVDGEDLLFKLQGYGNEGMLPGLSVKGSLLSTLAS